jgi:hypothetical protein
MQAKVNLTIADLRKNNSPAIFGQPGRQTKKSLMTLGLGIVISIVNFS